MAVPRHRASIHILTLFLLLWVGFDIGAHGVLASDFAPLPDATAAGQVSAGGAPGAGHLTHDHCFCHAVSVGAVLRAMPAEPSASGVMVRPLSAQVPRSDGSPLDHPPQLTA